MAECKKFVGRFHVIPANFVKNALHVCIGSDDSKRLHTKTDCKGVILGLIKRNENVTMVTGYEFRDDESALLVSAQVVDKQKKLQILPDVVNLEEGAITVHCTKTFLEHYQFREDDIINVKCVQTFLLQKVVFGVKTKEAFSWANRHFFSTGLLLSVCQENVLIRKDDSFLAPQSSVFSKDESYDASFMSDLYVVDCEPVQQGILGINTKVVLLRLFENDVNAEHNYKSVGVCKNIQSPIISNFAKELEKKHLTNGPDTDQTQDRQVLIIKPNVIERHRDWLKLVDINNEWDSLITVVMTTSTAKSVGAFDESFMRIHLECGKNEKHNTAADCSHVVIVKVRSPCSALQDSTVCLTPQLMFSLLPKPSSISEADYHVVFNNFSTRGIVDSCMSPSWQASMPYANEVHLALVNAPNNQVAKSYDGAIKIYFTQPKALSIGDVVAIPTSGDPAFLPDCQDTYDVRYPVLYFKVTKLSPNLPPWNVYLVDSNRSTLTLAGLAHSYIPTLATKFWSTKPCADFWYSKSPAGFDHYINSLCQWVLPYIMKSDVRYDKMFPAILVEGSSGIGKTVLVKALSSRLNMHLVQVTCCDLCGESSAATEARLRNVVQKAVSFVPCILLLKDIQALGKDRDGTAEDTRVSSCFKQILQSVFCTITEWPMVVIATTKSTNHVSSEIRDCFLHELKLEPPDQVQRGHMLEALLEQEKCSTTMGISHIAQRTAGLVLGDLSTLISHARKVAYQRVYNACSNGRPLSLMEEEDICTAGFSMLQGDLEVALDQLQSAHSDALGAPKIPDVSWEDVGGLADVKADILDTIQLPLEHPELFASGLRRSGVLLYGPPGTGKTLLAKAVATECSLNFLSVKGPELINMYVGQSEENVREVFHRARNASPCVIFFDELDSLAPNRGRSGDSGGVMDRVVSQLLAELDGLHKSCDTFVIGATNRPDLLDPALLRPGRFDKLLYLGVSEDKQAQLKILKALTRKFHLAEGASLEAILDYCPGNLTGADFYALCSDAMLNAMKRKIDLLEAGEDVDQTRLEVDNEDLLEALRNLVPSVSQDEMARYRELQASFKNSN